ncbi:hypothetical protein [Deinococcus sp. YIM 77859]|uniref:hypothetical protein n=1 Tax=Deinococcus sp. YIM 77859 TaxID=1540221 RepID=UPI000A3FC99A|nr:hypothetical protein [Deinococcus sp. YIM 77859]
MAAAQRWGHVVGRSPTKRAPLAVTELNAGDSSRASHVWRVEEADGPVILRRPWWTSPDVSAFMLGLARLFEVDPRNLPATADAYRFWRGLGVWMVPEVLGFTDFRGGAALQVAFVPGESPRDLREADAAELGRRVAAVHGHTAQGFGPVTGSALRLLSDFYPHALRVVREVTARFEPDAWTGHGPDVEAAFAAAPAPTRAVPMLLDWNGSQFVWRQGQPFALVDVEASALAPPELDLALWEVLLDARGAGAFRAAYASTRPFPDLGPHRAACRLLLRALQVEGSPPLRDWLALPPRFDP